MKFGVNTFIWTANFDRSNLPLLPQLKAGGFDGVEVPLFRPSEFATADIARGLAENGLECTICSVLTGGLSIISEDAAVRRQTRIHMEDCVKTAAEVGAKIMAGPLYSPVGYLPGRRRTADEWKWAVDCYQSLGPVLQQYGVTIAIEPLNRFETYFLNTAQDAAALCDQIGHPNVGVLFDTFHANIEEKDIAQGYRLPHRGPASQARAHLRKRSRYPRHGPRGMAVGLPGPARLEVRWMVDNRELRLRARRAFGRCFDLAGHCADSRVNRL
jgi:D-psicose/D-tagatose/L-ribulose 3-epimerase